MDIMKGIKIAGGLITAAVGGIVALKAGKASKTTVDDGTEQIDDEEILEMMEAEKATESPEEEEEPETEAEEES